MIDDIIKAVIGRFSDFGFCLHMVYTKGNAYYVYLDNTRIGYIMFYPSNLSYVCDTYEQISYDDLDIDILVGMCLCEVYYGS